MITINNTVQEFMSCFLFAVVVMLSNNIVSYLSSYVLSITNYCHVSYKMAYLLKKFCGMVHHAKLLCLFYINYGNRYIFFDREYISFYSAGFVTSEIGDW